MILFLVFFNIPKSVQLNFIGGTFQDRLIIYPLLILLVYSIYHFLLLKSKTESNKSVKIFGLFYLTFCITSFFIGILNYQYFDLLIDGSINQSKRLFEFVNFLKSINLNISEKELIIPWMIARYIKLLIIDFIYTFLGSYMIYCWYRNNWQTAFKIIIKAILTSLIIIFGYCVIELFYLAGNETAKNILIIITPYLHIIKSGGTWWPPLLLKGQLRSIFAEPSYYGIYFAFAMPMLWYVLVSARKYYHKIVAILAIVFFTFCLFLTQARTAVALFCGEVFILFVFTVYLRNKFIFKQVGKIFVASITAFLLSGLFINNLLVDNRYNIDSVESYVESNLTSLTSTSQRSNGARYSIMIADFKIGLDHPLIGVGTGLRNAYIPDYLPEIAKDNGEVKMWIKNQLEKGILRSGFPKLGEYTSRFAETGIIGLALFLIPPFILLRKLYFKITDKNMTVDDKLPYVFFTISLIGIMASGIGDSINITYCYWILLGLGYAMCFGKENDVETNGDTGSRQEY